MKDLVERRELSTEQIVKGFLNAGLIVLLGSGSFWLTNVWAKLERLEQSKDKIIALEAKQVSNEKRLDRIEQKIDLLLEKVIAGQKDQK